MNMIILHVWIGREKDYFRRSAADSVWSSTLCVWSETLPLKIMAYVISSIVTHRH